MQGEVIAACRQCGETRPLRRDRLCRGCHAAAEAERRRRSRIAALEHYSRGTMRCACCREAHVEFLAIDHVAGDGAEHRRSIGGWGTNVARWLELRGFPEGFQVLCFNCNWARHAYGACPHQKDTHERVDIEAAADADGGSAQGNAPLV